jgi:hypothetical protein
MKSTLDYVVEKYGLRLTTEQIADVMRKSPGEVRNQISREGKEKFPIKIYKEKPEVQQAPWFADYRDVADFIDRQRPQ